MVDEIVVKSSEDIKVQKKTRGENDIAIKHLEGRIEKIDKEIESIKNSDVVKEYKDKSKLTECIKGKSMKCDMCGQTFNIFVDLEK